MKGIVLAGGRSGTEVEKTIPSQLSTEHFIFSSRETVEYAVPSL